MSVQHSSTEWPIRVGGIYKPQNPSHSSAKVTAIVGEQVHHQYYYETGRTYETAPCSIATFCKLWSPEDQSPIPALVKVLKWYAEQSRLARLINSEGDAGRHALADDGGKMARAALALAGETGGEEQTNADQH